MDTSRTHLSPSAVAALLVATACTSSAFSPYADLSAGTCWPPVSFVGECLGVVGLVLLLRTGVKAWHAVTLVAGALIALSFVVSVSYVLLSGSGVCGSVAFDPPFLGN